MAFVKTFFLAVKKLIFFHKTKLQSLFSQQKPFLFSVTWLYNEGIAQYFDFLMEREYLSL